MSRSFSYVAALGSFLALSSASVARADPSALIAASDTAQVRELQVAKVMADEGSLWLRVRLSGKARLALVASDSALPSAPGADAWLRALDFTTRVRVAPPPGPLATCGSNQALGLVDTGLPEPALVALQKAEIAGSELDLRRSLEDAGLGVDPERIARFTQGVPAPYRISFYDAPTGGGDTAALRLLEHGNASGAPELELAGRDAVPISLIALATAAVLPLETAAADPSQFPVSYRAASSSSSSSDYLNARSSWLAEQPTRWLSEAQNSPALFAWTVFPPSAQVAPVTTRYFQGLPSGAACATQAQAAVAHGSERAADYVCGDHDDLQQSLAELGFGALRLSRLYGMLGSAPVAFRSAAGEPRSPLLNATDIDTQDCAAIGGGSTAGNGMSSQNPGPPAVVSGPDPDGSDVSDPGTPLYTDDGGCNLTVVDSCSGDSSSDPSSSDSCSGDSSSDSSSSDSCSGDSSSDSSSSDSCSGDSSSSDSSGASDSCSGDSSTDSGSDSKSDSCSGNSDSSTDSSGCGKNDGYDGDTCSGNAHSSAEATTATNAELRVADAQQHRRPRRVHLSLLTLLAAALALPLRRLRSA